MPLTRHFYELDEVQAAVFYCGGRPSWKETVFWTRELVISGYVSEAISVLFESWLWHRGPFHMRWLIDAMTAMGGEEVSMEGILTMAEALSRCTIKDHSLWAILVSSTLEGEIDALYDRVTPKSLVVEWPLEMDKREQFFLRAIHQHKAGAAWWSTVPGAAGAGIRDERVEWCMEWYAETVRAGDREWKEALDGYERLLGYRSEGYDRAIRLTRLLSLCFTADQRRKSMTALMAGAPLYPEEEAKWNRVLGRKAGRIYPIPYYGLYGTTKRGRMRQQETTVGELWDVRRGMAGVPCWDTDEKEAAATGATTGAAAIDSYFPDDLPDEWTAAEKSLSHGSGLLGSGEQVTLWGWMRRTMTGSTRLVWGRGARLLRSEVVRKRLEAIPLDTPFLTLLALPIQGTAIRSFAPVHKRKVVG